MVKVIDLDNYVIGSQSEMNLNFTFLFSEEKDSSSLSNGQAGDFADEFGQGHVTTKESTEVRSATDQTSSTVSSVSTSTGHTQSSLGGVPISGPTSNSVPNSNEASYFSEYQNSDFEEYDAGYFSSLQLDEAIIEPTQRVSAVSTSTASLHPFVLSPSPSSSSSPATSPENVPTTPYMTDEEAGKDLVNSYQGYDFYEFLSSSETIDEYKEYEELGDAGATLAIMTTTVESQGSVVESASDFLSYAEDLFSEGGYQYVSSDYQESADNFVNSRVPSTAVMVSASRGLEDNSYPLGDSLAEGILSSVEGVSGGDYGSVAQEHYSDYPEEYIGMYIIPSQMVLC